MVIAQDVATLPDVAAISAATLAELHFGVLLASDDTARRARVRRLSEIEALFDPLPIDAAVARSYAMLAHVVVSAGRRPRRRVMALLIAATAHARAVPLYTRDRSEFAGLEDEVDLIEA